ncbi:tyrosine-protein kinase receptor Tie-1-like isoform X2 [Haliotis asinina]|uniref:tyrosine-protein kinase receptor Tie-1-like isoform X2 n=1 Tax=Haliotis asinina TaxID=109174 RepID=UPI00353270EA
MYNFIAICLLLLQIMAAYGCRRGGRAYYKGNECRTCGTGCKDGMCDAEGHCSCKPQWAGRECTTRCTNGYVQGYSCKRCGYGCQGGRCDADDGTCRCKPGWVGSRCTTRCPPGFFVDGRICRRCSSRCSSRRCDIADGTCRCTSGWTGRHCTVKLEKSGKLAAQTVISWSSAGLTTQTPTNWSSTDFKPDGEQLTKKEKASWTYVLIYSLTPLAFVSCTSLILCLVLKRLRPKRSVKTSGAKVPSTADDLESDQVVYFSAVLEDDEDRHYDAIQDQMAHVGVSHDDAADENVYAIPCDNECDNIYENSKDGNLYEAPSVKIDRHIYEGLKTRTKI